MTDQKKNEKTDNHLKIDNYLLEKRTIMISGEINDTLAHNVNKQLWYLEGQDSSKEILIIINSPGGSTDSGFAILDTIRLLKSKVTTLVTGLAASFGSVLSIAATSGKILATPNSRIMVHQPWIGGVIRGVATDLRIHAEEIKKTRDQIGEVYSAVTKKPIEDVMSLLLDRDTWMSAEEAKDFGLLTDIVHNHSDVESLIK